MLDYFSVVIVADIEEQELGSLSRDRWRRWVVFERLDLPQFVPSLFRDEGRSWAPLTRRWQSILIYTRLSRRSNWADVEIESW
jgi:hypothetical protein